MGFGQAQNISCRTLPPPPGGLCPLFSCQRPHLQLNTISITRNAAASTTQLHQHRLQLRRQIPTPSDSCPPTLTIASNTQPPPLLCRSSPARQNLVLVPFSLPPTLFQPPTPSQSTPSISNSVNQQQLGRDLHLHRHLTLLAFVVMGGSPRPQIDFRGKPLQFFFSGVERKEPLPSPSPRAGGIWSAYQLALQCAGLSCPAPPPTNLFASHSLTFTSTPALVVLRRVVPLANSQKQGKPLQIFFSWGSPRLPLSLQCPPPTQTSYCVQMATLFNPYPLPFNLTPTPNDSVPFPSLVRFLFLLPPLLRQYLSTLTSHSQPKLQFLTIPKNKTLG